MELIEKLNGYKILIGQEEDTDDPRKSFDHAALMYCEHRHYSLGDKDGSKYLIRDDNGTWHTPKGSIALSINLYDHSGLRMSTHSFNDPWDSGTIGVIYMTADMVRKEFNAKRITKKLRSKVLGLLESEVNEYDMYLSGDVWYFIIEDRNGDTIDSCGGMYGYQYCLDTAREIVKSLPFQLTLPLGDDSDDNN